MIRIFKSLVIAILTTGLVATADAQKVPDQRVADLVQAGKIRVGLFSSQFKKDATSGDCEVSDRTWLERSRRG